MAKLGATDIKGILSRAVIPLLQHLWLRVERDVLGVRDPWYWKGLVSPR